MSLHLFLPFWSALKILLLNSLRKIEIADLTQIVWPRLAKGSALPLAVCQPRRLRRARQLAWICLSNYMKGSVIWLLNLAVTVVYINPCLSWNSQIYSHNKQAQEGAQKFPTSAVIFLAYLSNYWIANLKKKLVGPPYKAHFLRPDTC